MNAPREPAPPAVIELRDDRAPAATPATAIDPARVLTGTPLASVDNRYSDPGQRFHCGIWASSAGSWRVAYTEHEFCHLLAGRVRLTDAHGRVQEFAPGDAFVVPAGYRGIWESIGEVRKYYALYEPG